MQEFGMEYSFASFVVQPLAPLLSGIEIQTTQTNHSVYEVSSSRKYVKYSGINFLCMLYFWTQSCVQLLAVSVFLLHGCVTLSKHVYLNYRSAICHKKYSVQCDQTTYLLEGSPFFLQSGKPCSIPWIHILQGTHYYLSLQEMHRGN